MTNKRESIKGFHCQPKSRHFPNDLNKSLLESFQQGDQECLAQMYLVERPKFERQERASNQAVAKFPTLSKFYNFDNKVKQYFANNPKSIKSLFDTLIEANKQIKKYFSEGTKSDLIVLQDGEGKDERLFVKIHTNLEPEEAISQLNKFDQNWWFRLPSQIHNHLEFNLEFD